jgi:hypothetical protein
VPDSSSNVGFAHDLTEHDPPNDKTHHKWLSFVEAFVLAIVAVATAWSGYQASRWEGLSTKAYALYERYGVLSQAKSTLGGQDRLYDIVTFNGWVAARLAGSKELADYYQRRFRPEYAKAFAAWMALDPFHNRKAPPGPIFMPQYKNANANAADGLEAAAAAQFKVGVEARERSDDYVRVTVFLATVLFLTALSQRYGFVGPRLIIVGIAMVLLVFSMFGILRLPRT